MQTRKLRVVLLGCVAAVLGVVVVYGIAFKKPLAGVNQDKLQQHVGQSVSEVDS